MKTTLHPENDIFRKIASGDERAFRKIFDTYNPKLFPFVSRFTRSEAVAEDIVQETFIRLWIHRSEVAEMEYPGAWLYKVASNLSLSHLRSQSSEIRRLRGMKLLETDEHSSALDQIAVKEMQIQISRAVDHMPPKRQYIYKLSREEGLNHQQIAELLNISTNTVKNQLVCAFKGIKDTLGM